MSDRIHAAGGEAIAVSVDSEERQAAMYRRWPTPHTTYVADPGGEYYLRPMGMFDPEERGGIGLPGMFVLDPDGNEVFAYRGHDFADRRHDEDVIVALEQLGLGPIDAPAGGPDAAAVDVDQPGAFTPAMLNLYFRGNRMGAHAILRRADGDEAKRLAREHREMCDGVLEAWKQLRPD